MGNLCEIIVVIFSTILNMHQWSENLRFRTGSYEFIITNVYHNYKSQTAADEGKWFSKES